MFLNINIISIFFSAIIIFEFLLFFHIDLFSNQLKLVRVLQFILFIYFLYSFYFKFKKNELNKILYNKIDFFFILFITYFFLNASIYFLINDNFDIFKLSLLEILKYIFYYLIYVYFIRFFYKDISLYIIYKALYYFLFFIIILGILEYGFNMVFNDNIIPRQLNYGVNDDYIGLRFHSFLGEPRDASVILLKLISLIFLFEIYLYKNLKSYFLISLTFIAAILTVSTTFIVAIILFVFLYFLYNRSLLNSLLILVLSIFIFFSIIQLDQRIFGYISDVFLIHNIVNDAYYLKSLNIYPQLINIIPIYIFISDLINLNIFEFLFGNGLKSSSFIKYFLFDNEGSNPHSQLSRLVYDTGLVGLLVFVFLLNYYKSYIMKVNFDKKNIILISLILFLSASLAHRTGTFLIFLSIVNLIYIKNKYELSN